MLLADTLHLRAGNDRGPALRRQLARVAECTTTETRLTDRRPSALLMSDKSKVERSGGRKTHQNRTEAKENQSASETKRNSPGYRQWHQDQKW
jgi:hypothetical protein